MKLNAQAGDLCVITKGKAAGKIVLAVEYMGFLETLTREHGIRHVHWWKTDTPLRNMLGQDVKEIEDYKLRPLRDNDGEDETLTWAGKPSEIKEPACQ